MVDWSTLFKDLSVSVIVLGAFAWVAKSLGQRWIDRDLKSFETSLKAVSDRELESLKAQLSLAAKEREIVLGALQERRVTIVADYYRFVNQTASALDRLASYPLRFEEIPDDVVRGYVDAAMVLVEHHRQNAIWLEPETSRSITEFVANVLIPAVAINPDVFSDVMSDPVGRIDRIGVEAAIRSAQERVRKIKELLEADFRLLLGVTLPSD